MGGPRTVSCSLDCCKTLPRSATTIHRRDHRKLSHSVNKKSHDLFCISSVAVFSFGLAGFSPNLYV
ncbi:hypothetical protein BDR03DRAFT_956659, partial [Suillus americanus]